MFNTMEPPQDIPQNAPTADISDSRQTKLCFVTIGATAGFNALVREVLSAPFLSALAANNYTDLLVQHGRHAETLFADWRAMNGLTVEQKYGVHVTGFPYNLDGLAEELKAVKKDGSVNRGEGVVISHAGTGTILEALRYGVPLVVVPNPDLMHNHQEELAKQLETVGWVIHGKIGDLPSAINATESFRDRLHSWPPANRFDQNGIQTTMDDELGFVD